ncbi:hypothetical protein A3K86_18195 [Photobacterium jeanii]|uniref:Uncharacterized protein n=1 Tax=Photobacterium jeanii TaxID=858640 RepID=A0A178K1D1_9GAMM|nr:hypothetical protein A3K86_18195 [Photobacterium jeanii]PST90433.1 hypothetical protein C9I91_07295 [Photobacterium jeanii]
MLSAALIHAEFVSMQKSLNTDKDESEPKKTTKNHNFFRFFIYVIKIIYFSLVYAILFVLA